MYQHYCYLFNTITLILMYTCYCSCYNTLAFRSSCYSTLARYSSRTIAGTYSHNIRILKNCLLEVSNQNIHTNTIPIDNIRKMTIHSTSPLSMMTNKNSSDNQQEELYQQQPQQQLLFGKFRISSNQIFYQSSNNLSVGIVNLRPIVPGHVLIIPKRVVPKLSQLTHEEYTDLWLSVRIVQNMLEKYYHSDDNKNSNDGLGFNVAVQDGEEAGQSVPHVHVHILPRKRGDFARNDDVYDELQDWAPTEEMRDRKKQRNDSLHVPDDDERKDRTMQQMEEEANLYRTLLLQHK